MKTSRLLALLLLAAAPALAADDDKIPLPPDAVILTNGEDSVTTRDFEAVLSRVPEHLRFETRASLERVAGMVDEVYQNRVMAREAVVKGLDKDPVVQQRLKQVQEAYLASLAMREVEKAANTASYEKRAREIYDADRAKFQEPEAVRVIVATLEFECRSPEETRSMAVDIAERGRKGEDIRALTDAFRLSRDPGRRRVETVATRAQLEPEIAALAFDQLKPGEVGGPVEVRGGYAIVKLVEKRPARTIPFEAVRLKLAEDERIKAVKAASDTKIREIQHDPRLKLDRANLLALQAKVDTEALKRQQEEILRKSRGR